VPLLRFSFLVVLVFVLLAGGIVFGKDSFKNVFETLDPYVTKISQAADESFALISTFASFGSSVTDLAAKEVWQDTKDFYKGVGLATSKIGRDFKEGLEISVDNTISYGTAQVAEVGGLFKEYLKWLSQNYFAANQFVEEKLSQGFQTITQPFVKAYNFVSWPWRVPEIAPPEKVVTEKIIEKEIVKEVEVERITKVEPIKEIEKVTEVTKIDEKELAKIKGQISQIKLWETDIENLRAITKKLQAYPSETPVPTAPIYIGPQGLQVGGTLIAPSLGVPGLAGIETLGVRSATIGSDSGDKLNVYATANFISPVTIQNTLKVGGVDHYLNVDANGNLTITGTITAATFASAADDSTVRKSGEEVLRGSVSIFRFDMPAQTSTTTYFQISKYFSDNPLSTTTLPKLPGGDRIFRLAISYADTLPTDSSSTWRIYQTSPSATTCTFYLTGQNCTSTNPNCLSLEEGKPYLTSKKFISGTSCYIPDSNWQVELKLPDETKKIRIFNIFLMAYDKIK